MNREEGKINVEKVKREATAEVKGWQREMLEGKMIKWAVIFGVKQGEVMINPFSKEMYQFFLKQKWNK